MAARLSKMKSNRIRDVEQRQITALYPRSWALLRFGSILVALIALLLLFFFSRFFTIEFVDVTAQGGIDAAAVREIVFEKMDLKRFFLFPQKNIIVFSASTLRDELKKRFIIESLIIHKQLPHTIRLSISGEPFRVLAISHHRVLDLASDGSVRADVSDESSEGKPVIALARALAAKGSDPMNVLRMGIHSDAPIIIIESADDVNTQESMLSADDMIFLRKIFAGARERGFHPFYFVTALQTPTIRLKTEQGWDILFSKIESPDSQLANAALILGRYFKKNKTSLQYIDVRFGNRIFYK